MQSPLGYLCGGLGELWLAIGARALLFMCFMRCAPFLRDFLCSFLRDFCNILLLFCVFFYVFTMCFEQFLTCGCARFLRGFLRIFYVFFCDI